MSKAMHKFFSHCSYALSISLKSKLTAVDLYRLINDIRRRVDHEVTFEGTQRRVE